MQVTKARELASMSCQNREKFEPLGGHLKRGAHKAYVYV